MKWENFTCYTNRSFTRSCFTILLSLVIAHANAYSMQDSVSVNLKGKDITIASVFQALQQQTGLIVFYNNNVLNDQEKIDANFVHAGVKQVMNYIIKGRGLTFEIRGRFILLKKKETKPEEVRRKQSVATAAEVDTVITGTVTSETGAPLIGVSVGLKGAHLGAVTDQGGRYSLSVPNLQGKLVFSYVGYNKKVVPINGQQNIDVVLKTSVSSLEHLVVVGYGTKKKKDLTGSVYTLDFEKQAYNRPLMNVSSALSGLVPGLQAFQTSGKPGDDGATLHIRGYGTLNNSKPLVLVDGFVSNMDFVNPYDIKSVTVLKDAASAAIYGSRAANGVILITTKDGSGEAGKPRFSYNGYVTLQNAVNTLPFVSNYAKHMKYINESLENIGRSPIFSKQSIQASILAYSHPNDTNSYGVPNYKAFPNTNWFDVLFNTGITQHHNLSVSGASDKFKYYVSLGYLNNEGIIENADMQRIRFRANVEVDPLRWLTVGTRISGSRRDKGVANVSRAFHFLAQTTPGVYPGTTNKLGIPYVTEESSNANNLIGFLNDKSGKDIMARLYFSLYAKVAITDKLTFTSRYNYAPDFGLYNYHSRFRRKWDYTTNQLVSESVLSNAYMYYSTFKRTRFITDQLLRYHTKIDNNHDIKLLVGFNETRFDERKFHAATKGMLDWSLGTLNTGVSMDNLGGTETDWAMRSLFGRVNYAFKDKYLFEANLRYDGSSRFSPYHRWGLFPSLSAGWRMLDEPFMQSFRRYFQNLKVRISWGNLGNASSGNYDWQATYSGFNTVIDGVPSIGLAVAKLGNNSLQWEKTAVTDIGIDVGIFKNRLTMSLDLYNKQTTGILYTPSLYLTSGTVAPSTENIAGVNNKGVEVNLKWRDHIGKLSYNIEGNFAYNRNMVTKYRGPLQKGWILNEEGDKVYVNNIGEVSQGGFGGRILEGHTMGEHYLYRLYHGDGSYSGTGEPDPYGGPSDGMIRTKQDLRWLQAMMATGRAFLPLNKVGKNHIWYGDLLYADIDGDGRYGDGDDMVFTGKSSLPKFNFGLNMSMSYRNFDLSAIWFGSAGFYLRWRKFSYNSPMLRNGWGVSKHYAENAYDWDPDSPNDPNNNQNGSLPRLMYNTKGNDGEPSTFWDYNASFLKLRSLQIGYTIPKRISQKIMVDNLRVYATGENLLTITDYPGLDPEMGNDVNYPIMKQFAFGVNVTF